MQFHLDGFRPGDPRLSDPEAPKGDLLDVAIVGAGPAGLTLAAQLARIGGLNVRLFERKEGPMEVGQADGIACRSMEMFQSFGFARAIEDEAYWVNETAFWRPSGSGLTRADRIRDVEEDLSEFPHVILNQARVHDHYLAVMERSALRLVPDYAHDLREIEEGETLRLTFDTPTGPRTVQTRTLVGCDGARSRVRRHLGHALEGKSARQLWGVMDVLCATDFPDIRLKAAVQSEGAGSCLIIPREGGYLVRLYVELGDLAEGERAADRGVTAQMLEEKVRAILSPYSFEIREVAWISAYEIGQRVCPAFDDGRESPRIFIAGDACHTHSPKAGQGMNVSMADTFNLGWKLSAVLRGEAPETLLATYSAERQAKAQELIDFDKDMARLFSRRPETPEEAATFQRYFQTHGRYTAGVETRYAPSILTGTGEHQSLATGQVVGKRFHSAPVIRLADARPMQLGHVMEADGRWRLFAFAGTEGLDDLCDWLERDPASPILRHTPGGADIDSVIDLRAVYPAPHREMDVSALPPLLRPAKGRYGLTDHEKVFCPDPAADIHAMRGIDKERGALIVVRPDHYIADVLPLTAREALTELFARVLTSRG